MGNTQVHVHDQSNVELQEIQESYEIAHTAAANADKIKDEAEKREVAAHEEAVQAFEFHKKEYEIKAKLDVSAACD